MGVTVSNDISSQSTHQIHSPKSMYTPKQGPYQSKAVQRIVKFETSKFWELFLFFLWNLNMVVNGGWYNMRYLENGWS